MRYSGAMRATIMQLKGIQKYKVDCLFFMIMSPPPTPPHNPPTPPATKEAIDDQKPGPRNHFR